MTGGGRTSTDSRERRVSSAVFQWASGLAAGVDGRVALCLSGQGLAEVVDRGCAADVYLVPVGDDVISSTGITEQILTFDGRFERSGDIMHIGSGYEIELKDYLAVPFMPITRPTVVTCTTSAAWQAFLEDADEALASGVFIPQLASPSVVLADQSVIDAAIDGTSVGINRFTVDSASSVRYRLGGPVAGTIGSIDLCDQPAAAFFLAEGESPDAAMAVAREFAARPWIRRYLAALHIVGGAGGEAWSISGFGDDLTRHDVDPTSRRSGHLIVWRGEDYRLVAESGRRFALGKETAVAVDLLLASSSLDQALASARAVGITRPSLGQELDELCTRLASAGVTLDLADADRS